MPPMPPPTDQPTGQPGGSHVPVPTGSATPPLRASDGDRNAVIERLGDALAEGALDTAEYNRRLETAASAVTQAQLATLTADLPVSQAATRKAAAEREAAQARADKREWFNEWGYWAGGALIMSVIWGISCVKDGDLRFYWPVWPLGIWAAILVSYALWPERDKDHGR